MSAQTPYTIKVVEPNGLGGFTVIETITRPVFTQPITRVLNGMGSTAFSLPRWHPAYSALATNKLKREVQIFRGFDISPIWWGVPMASSLDVGGASRTFQCAEVIPWLLSRRNFGKTNRTNLLTNPSFESGFTGWVTTGVDLANATNVDSILGSFCADLTEASFAPDASVQQSFSYTASGFGDLISVAGWRKIVTFTGPALQYRGLYVEWSSGGNFRDKRYQPIDGDNLRGQWERSEIPITDTIWIPPNVIATINVRGYAVQGQIRWDALFCGVMESTSTGVGGTDIATFAATIINHAQDAAYGKNGLDIGITYPTTGFKINMAWQHAEHANIWTSGLKDLTDREDGIDLGSDYTSSSRVAHVYDRTNGAYGKGADMTALDLTLGGDWVADYGHEFDGNSAANNVTVTGEGDGPDREEGGFIDNTKFGGRHFETVVQAPVGAPINTLDTRAQKIGRTRSNPGIVNIRFKPTLCIEGINPVVEGDKLNVPAYDDFVDAGTYRVIDWALNPNDDQLTVGVAAL